MKITIEIEAELDGEWLPEYAGDLISKFDMPGVVLCGDDGDGGGCAVLLDDVTWKITKGENE